jgi:hypothetical protein
MKQELQHPVAAAGSVTGWVCQAMGVSIAGLVAYLLWTGKPWHWPAETAPSQWVVTVLITMASLTVAFGLFGLGHLFRRRLLFGVLSLEPLVLIGHAQVRVQAARTVLRIGTTDALGVPGVGHVAWLGSGWYIVCADAVTPFAAFLARRTQRQR